MPRIVFILGLIVCSTKGISQQDYFLYIQADGRQPFYARLNSQMYSSSESGHLIIPKLHDSAYLLTIGFPGNTFTEQRFPVEINKKDKGFQLKNFGQKGWGLLNLQNMSVIMNVNPVNQNTGEYSGVRKTDAFSELLANVVNDSAILYTAVRPATVERSQQQKETASPPQVPFEIKESTPVSTPVSETNPVDNTEPLTSKENTQSVPIAATKDPVTEAPGLIAKEQVTAKETTPKKNIVEKPFIARIEEDNSEGMYTATYIEQYNFSTDTIRIFIPQNARLLVTPPAAKNTQLNPPPEQETASIQEKTVSPRTVNPAETATPKTAAKQLQNTDCKNFASEHDVDKLRVKLLSEKIMDEKLKAASKFFKNRCFTVKQIKALTELFPTDETKFRFFEISYPFVSDTGNFYMLEEIIENPLYKGRFKAMINQ